MRQLFVLALLLFPSTAFASVEVRISLNPTFRTYRGDRVTSQYWAIVPKQARLDVRSSEVGRNQSGWQRQPLEAPSPATARSSYDDSIIGLGQTPDHTFRSGTPNYRVLKTVEVVATAYNSRRNQTDGTPWRVATGRLVRDGDIACNFLPLGTLVRIVDGPDLIRGKIFRVEDRLADPPPLGWNQIDIWMLRVSDAIAFGKKRLTLQVLGDPLGEAPH